MNSFWSLATHGDPLGTVRDFVRKVWLETNLDGMLVTMSGKDQRDAIPRFITEVSTLDQTNPFMPLMEINAAKLIPGLLADHPDSKIGALLRPCELRALIEMKKHTTFKVDNLLTISVDCLGTLPADEYQWRIERIGKDVPQQGLSTPESADNLAKEALKFARQGGIVPYRYRSACQVCISPAAEYADINIHIIGLPVRQQMLVLVNDPALELRFHIETLVAEKSDQELILQHERVVSRMNERHQRTMERIKEGLGGLLPADVDAVISQLESCGECQNCMNVCPICSVDRPVRSPDGHYDRSDVMRWLVSCAGCGMCEQACPNHFPISTIFAHIRQQLDQEWEYLPGRSMDEALPSI
jgi:formate dehydrogenase (coenzyme F420) beta subunit